MLRDDIRCPIRIPASEYCSSRRCYYFVFYDNVCPVHGNVNAFMKKYKKLKQLTNEEEIGKHKEVLSLADIVKRKLREKLKSFLLGEDDE